MQDPGAERAPRKRAVPAQPPTRSDQANGQRATRSRSRHIAEVIADDLREQILAGGLQSGDLLSRQEDLIERFGASRPSVREALRILQTEGLVRVRRGKFGGAVVDRPGENNAAHTLGVILRAQGVSVDDLGAALREIEPTCAALCAARADRAAAVVPRLHDLNLRARDCLDRPREMTTVSRQFHEELVALCGNRTLILVVGALESVWSAHADLWAVRTTDRPLPLAKRRRAVDEHEQMVELISAGDAEGAARLAKRHLSWVPLYAENAGDWVDPELLVDGAPRPRVLPAL